MVVISKKFKQKTYNEEKIFLIFSISVKTYLNYTRGIFSQGGHLK